MTPNERKMVDDLNSIALSYAADELELRAQALPLGTTFIGGGLHDAPKFDVMMWAVWWMRARADSVVVSSPVAGVRWCSCGQPWKPAAGLFGTTEETRCHACVLRDRHKREGDGLGGYLRDILDAWENWTRSRNSSGGYDLKFASVHADAIEAARAAIGEKP